MKQLPKKLISFFYYTKSERLGMSVLLILCVVLVSVSYFWSDFFAHKPLDVTEHQQRIAQQIKEKEQERPYFDDKNDASDKEDAPVKPFLFDPNTATESALLQLGLPRHTVQSIIKYRTKGGHFYKPEDLGKIYTLSKPDFERLLPFVSLQGSSPTYNQGDKYPSVVKAAPTEVNLSVFDPNTATETELLTLGLSQKTVKTLLNYREKGGRFKDASDLKKIYSISPEEAERLMPYVRIQAAEKAEILASSGGRPSNVPTAYNATMGPRKSTTAIIDVNRSGVEDWKTLPGIGEGYAQRIVKFREKLGGFSSTKQVAETFGLPDSIFQRILPQLKHSPIIQKIPINSVAIEVLKNHPCFGYKVADAIARFRANHGRINNLADLQKLPAFTPEVLEKIGPYLSYE